ncbi:MAG: hypothetical protein VZR73_06795 [Acutalibacteraceae bacterium]|nr:hypothetical protein [Acutalibacteraceae bacterium]
MNYMDLFSAANREKPKFMALAQAIIGQINDLLAVVPLLDAGYSISYAEGTQLDEIGASFGIARPDGMSDANYRKVLAIKVATFRWNGANDAIANLLNTIAPGSTYIDNCNCSVTIHAGSTLPLPAADLFPIPAGVKTITS